MPKKLNTKNIKERVHSIQKMNDNQQQDQKTIAQTYYEKQLERCRRYNEKHREEAKKRSKEAYSKIKEDPEKYELFREKRRLYALKRKEILKAQKEKKEELKNDEL